MPVDSVAAADSIQTADSLVRPSTGWDDSTAGPVMLLSVAENSAVALVVFPMLTDSTLAEASATSLDSLVDTPVELFSRRGLAGATSVIGQRQRPTAEGCLSWPQARLADAATEPWRVGFVRGVVAPLPLDSIEAMTGSDSAAVTREIARLSSAAAEGDDPVFRGLPFIVRRAYRFTHGATTALAAEVVRKISEEANPREERILLVAERPVTATGEYTTVFVSRTSGSEDAVRTNEIIGAFRFVKGDVPALVIAHDYFDGGRVALLQKDGTRWRITWRSAYSDC
ncbi:MAG: hypothetical protein ACSLFK_04370 [Gemmatimonadaceae bacterium]